MHVDSMGSIWVGPHDPRKVDYHLRIPVAEFHAIKLTFTELTEEFSLTFPPQESHTGCCRSLEAACL